MTGNIARAGEVFVIKEPECCALGKDFQPKLPPLPQEHTDNIVMEVNRLKQGILPPSSPLHYELP